MWVWLKQFFNIEENETTIGTIEDIYKIIQLSLAAIFLIYWLLQNYANWLSEDYTNKTFL